MGHTRLPVRRRGCVHVPHRPARFEDLPAEAVAKAKAFLLDTIGVGLAGTSDSNAARVLAAAAQWGAGTEATI